MWSSLGAGNSHNYLPISKLVDVLQDWCWQEAKHKLLVHCVSGVWVCAMSVAAVQAWYPMPQCLKVCHLSWLCQASSVAAAGRESSREKGTNQVCV